MSGWPDIRKRPWLDAIAGQASPIFFNTLIGHHDLRQDKIPVEP